MDLRLINTVFDDETKENTYTKVPKRKFRVMMRFIIIRLILDY